MARLAFCSPLPPYPSGVADYSAEILALLAPHHEIDVFEGQGDFDAGALPGSCRVLPASRLAGEHRARPYDLAVHQMGNGPGHAFVYPLLKQVPGLVVLHDLVLHHSRAAMSMGAATKAYEADRADVTLRDAAHAGAAAYRAEVASAYPREASRIVATHLNTIGDLLPYAYPLFQPAVAASRAVGVHNGAMGRAIAEEMPQARVFPLVMPAQERPVDSGAAAAARRAAGIAEDAIVVGCFGLVTREKRIETVARAVVRAAADFPTLRLLIVGPVPDSAALEHTLEGCGARARTTVAGRVPMESLPAHMAAADIVVHLRYPTARETSAALLRVMAQGRPTIVSDLDNFEAPDDAVVRIDVAGEEGEVTRAILRLAGDRALRDRLGRRAAAFVAEQHSPARALESYERAIAALA